jgi:hypothetical protein
MECTGIAPRFFTSALDRGKHSARSPRHHSGRAPREEVGWAPELSWTPWKRENNLTLPVMELQFYISRPSSCTD